MKNAKIIQELSLSYAMELETVQNYIAASVTQDMVIGILGGEEDHRREFIGFLKEYEKR